MFKRRQIARRQFERKSPRAHAVALHIYYFNIFRGAMYLFRF